MPNKSSRVLQLLDRTSHIPAGSRIASVRAAQRTAPHHVLMLSAV